MKNSLLLLMTPNMSLEKWSQLGQLSRELSFYDNLCKKANLKLIIYSYGRNDESFLKGYTDFKVICMPSWIPQNIPFKLQNFIYHFCSLFLFKGLFKQVALAKTNQFRAFPFGILLKVFFKIPLAIRMGFYYSHFQKLSRFARLKEWFAFKCCDLILTTSTEAGSHIKHAYNINENKILSMSNNIDLDVFKPLALKKEYDIIFVGRLEQQKNISLLLEVLSKTNLKTLIIGKGNQASLIRKAQESNDNIIWKERVDNYTLPQYYNKARCFVILSEYEGSPKALLEAMACGLPCIGANTPGTRECIIDGINGISVEPEISDVIKALDALFKDDALAAQLGNGAALWVDAHCDMSKNIVRELEFYSGYLNSRGFAYSI